MSTNTKVITGVNTRWSYVSVFQPKSINGSTPKYSVSLIIPKDDKKTLAAVNAAIQAAYDEGAGKHRTRWTRGRTRRCRLPRGR